MMNDGSKRHGRWNHGAWRAGALAGLLTLAAGGTCAAAEAPATSEPVAGREQLHAVLWMQTAAEYRAAVEQTWRLATERLATALQPGTAALEQAGMDAAKLAALPTAVIVDLDETILDNSFYQARLARDGAEYSEPTWQAWMQEAAAPALPGAREYLLAAARAGHRIFYLTNRECPQPAPAGPDPCPPKTWTRSNLLAAGFPGADDPASLTLRGERPEWRGGDKSVRRARIAERYRIVAMAGDDLRDFVDRDVYAARRAELAPLFGTRWFLLPNAMYGSWERALAQPACPPPTPRKDCPGHVITRKYSLLETAPPPLALEGAAGRSWDAQRERLRLATWNIEYLVEPSTYAALAGSCTRDAAHLVGTERRLPCDVVPRLDRKAADFAALRRYAARLDADVLALQEVDGPGAARLVLPGYEFCFSTQPHLQKNGFAIRRALPFRCEGEYLPVSLGDRLRRGMVVTLFPGSANEMTLLDLRFKSGCTDGPLTAATFECGIVSEQLPAVAAWIEEQVRAGRRFAVLGDFNRRLALESGPARDAAGRLQNLWATLVLASPGRGRLVNVTSGQRFTKCVPGDAYDAYIDQIVLGGDLAQRMLPRSFQRVTFTAEDARQFGLSDHCPVGIELRLR